MATQTVPTLVAHRGYPTRYPENTLLGIQAAVKAGARWFELDVQLCRDRVPFLCHDDTLERTAGLKRRIMDMSAAELACVDVGEPLRFGPRYAGTHPTPLTELATWLKQQPGVHAFVEIKEESLRHFGRETVVEKVMQAVKPALAQSVIISFDATCLTLARAFGAGPVGWALYDAGPATVATAGRLAPEYLFVGDRLFTEARAALSGPWRWAVYQVQDPVYASELTQRGAHMVETDAIAEMLAAYAPARP
jgi:glycerophosphoryl diester phosphodiesterase